MTELQTNERQFVNTYYHLLVKDLSSQLPSAITQKIGKKIKTANIDQLCILVEAAKLTKTTTTTKNGSEENTSTTYQIPDNLFNKMDDELNALSRNLNEDYSIMLNLNFPTPDSISKN